MVKQELDFDQEIICMTNRFTLTFDNIQRLGQGGAILLRKKHQRSTIRGCCQAVYCWQISVIIPATGTSMHYNNTSSLIY